MLQDLRYALRSLRQNPGFSAAALLTLALGIGANTAMFSLLDQVALRKLPVPNPDALIVLDSPGPNQGTIHQQSSFSEPFSYPMYADFRDQSTTTSGVLARFPAGVTLGDGQSTRIGTAEIVSGNYFDVLGLEPAAGRLLHASDDGARLQHPVAVLGWTAFQRHFAGDPSVVGRTIHVNAHPMTIVGVAPRRFHSVQVGLVPDVYVPMAMKPALTPGWDGLDDRRTRWLDIMARIEPGVSFERARAELDLLYRRILDREARELKDASPAFLEKFRGKHLAVYPGARGRSDLRGDFTSRLTAVTALVGLVLLVACANLANLLAAKTAGRQRELALKTALGAPRGRLMRDLLLQSVILALAGGALGLLLSDVLLSAAIRALPFDGIADAITARVDGRVLAFAFLASAFSGILFGIVPALELLGADLSPRLREGGGAVGSRRAKRWRKALIVGQVALSVVVLAAAGLFARSLQKLLAVDPGFEVRNVLTFGVAPDLSGYTKERALDFFQRLETRLRGLPDVAGAAMLDNPLLADSTSSSTIRIDGYEVAEGENMNPRFFTVSPGYFDALGVRRIAGRGFTDADTAAAAPVVIVNEVMARKYWGEPAAAVGQRIRRRREEDGWMEIVGVVRDGPTATLREETPRGVYVPVSQLERGAMNFYVRTAGPLAPLVPEIRRVVAELDPRVPVIDLRTLEGQVEISLFVERMAAALSMAFAGLAAFLAGLGLYGVLALAVTGRRRELGVRMALGADARSIAGLVVRDGLRPVAWGVGIGLAVAVPATFLLRKLLYQIQPFDVPTFAAIPLVLGASALLACWLPARRAARTDPASALRSDA